jgi:hypothetical protein
MDETPSFEGGVEQADSAPGGEITESTQQVEDAAPEPPRQYVEVDDPDNRYVRVKVDGEDREIPYSEALKGYSREADYTRKSQEVARQREQADYGLRLQQALESNPALTLQILSQQYGFNPQVQAPQPEPEVSFDDPLERALHEERQAREALEQRINAREADQALEMAVGNLRGRYNATDEDIREVIGTAYRMQVGVEALPMIYESLAFQRLNARVQQIRQQQTEEQQRVTAKQQASQIVSNGAGASSNGLTNVIDPNRTMTIREAALAAMEQAGL